jgi:hypothetical protein
MATPRSPFLARLGCGHLAMTLLVSCLLLVLNSLIISNLLRTGLPTLPESLRDRRWIQAIVFLGPVLLLVVQWWTWDVALDWLWPARSRMQRD